MNFSTKGLGWRLLLLGLALIVLGILMMLFGAPTRAAAADGDSSPYTGWRPLEKLGVLCVSYPASGGWYKAVSDSVNAWNSTDVDMVRRDNCAASGFPAQNTLKLMAYQTTETSWCARTVGSAGWGNRTVERKYQAPKPGVTVAAYGSTVQFNWNPKVATACRSTIAKVTHLVAHEAGHWIGLDHDAGDIMRTGISWNYTLPGATSKAQANALW